MKGVATLYSIIYMHVKCVDTIVFASQSDIDIGWLHPNHLNIGCASDDLLQQLSTGAHWEDTNIGLHVHSNKATWKDTKK